MDSEDGVALHYSDELMQCQSCTERFYTPLQLLESGRARAGALRSHAGFFRPDEIRAIRERFGLTQADLEQLLGTGRKTVVRWESGAVCQSATAERVLRLIDKVPGAFEVLAAQAVLPAVAAALMMESVIDCQPVRLIAQTLVGPDLRLATGGALRLAESTPLQYYSTTQVREGFAEVVPAGAWKKDCRETANADYALAS